MVRKRDNAVVGAVLDISRQRWIVDPGTGKKLASPARVGWENDDFILCEMTELVVPDGKRVVGERTRVYDDQSGKVAEGATIEDKPTPKEPTDAQRLEKATGLRISEIKAVLAQ
jgi:hypothetical protein